MGRRLTDRQLRLRAARDELRAAQVQLKQDRQLVAAAKRRLAELSRCDWCGAQTFPYGAELQLCEDCSKERNRLNRIKFLAAHGYGPDGQRLPRADRAAA